MRPPRFPLCVHAGDRHSGCSCNGTLRRTCALGKFGGAVGSSNECRVCGRYSPRAVRGNIVSGGNRVYRGVA